MLSSGARAVPSSACLRCELRCVLQHLRPLPSTHRRPYTSQRTFSTVYRRQNANDSETRPLVKENTGDVYYKHISPTSRIVGKRGRKQRQTSESLATNSLGEKSEIVIFRDVLDTRKKRVEKTEEPQDVDIEKQSLKGLSLTAEEIEAAMSGSGQAPDEEEVNMSIEALRPQAPVLDEKEDFPRLHKELLSRYSPKQLSRYLGRALRSRSLSTTVVRELEYSPSRHSTSNKSKFTRTISFTRSRWQPGRTPLDQRRISETPALPSLPKGMSGPKARVAQRIIRVAWEITTDLEEQKVGELEIEMTPWAIALFFDTNRGGRPTHEVMIEPPMLLKRSDIRPYRPDNIIRITARRQDAEDIAIQLENKVLLMGKQQLQLSQLIKSSEMRVPGSASLQHFRKQELEIITQRTQAIFMQESSGCIGIYSFKQSDRLTARRLLLSLLDLPSRNVKNMILEPSDNQQSKASPASLALVPVFPDRGVHFRDRSKMLARVTMPVRKELPTYNPDMSPYSQAETMSRDISSLLEELDEQKRHEPAPASERSYDPSSFWAGKPFTTSSSWWVHLGLLLRETTSKPSGQLMQNESADGEQSDKKKTSLKKSLFMAQVPGYETLLSYFEPNRRRPNIDGSEPNPRAATDMVARKSTIVAHFTPNPFTQLGSKALTLFPRLELTMRRRVDRESGEEELKVEGLRGIIAEHHVDIPLPEQAIDIRLSRSVASHANLPAVLADPQIQQFVTTLRESANSSSKTALEGKHELSLKTPAWMAESDDAARKAQSESKPEIPVSYLFERFEQVQSTGFRKNLEALDQRAEHSAAVRMFHKGFPRGARLQYKEVDAGDIGGRQTEISFKVHKNAPREEDGTADHEVAEQQQPSPVALSAILVPALATAEFVTRVCRNEVTMWRGQSGLLRTEQTPIHKVAMAEEGGRDDRGDRGLDEEVKADAESQ
jgi:hypothetical protein